MLSHRRSHPDFDAVAEPQVAKEKDPDIIPQELLSKYILYAKKNCSPQLQATNLWPESGRAVESVA